MEKVRGRRMAMAILPVMPGRAPTTTPMKLPRRMMRIMYG
jgi:hypothetical protein